jgi:hypothetical protein
MANTQGTKGARSGSSQHPVLFTEYTEINEASNYGRLTTLISGQMEKLYGGAKRALRDTHAKSHAAVMAHLEIFDIDEAEIKARLSEIGLTDAQIQKITVKQGLFAKPGRYPVWLRYANGNGGTHPDKSADTRSMSVKIMGVEGSRLKEAFEPNNQDIITQNCDIFFIDTIQDYFGFLKAIFKSKILLVIWLLFHIRQALALRKITSIAPKSLLTERYWSGSAYALGTSDQGQETCPDVESVTYPAVVKYAFTPVAAEAPHTELARQPIDLPKKEISKNYYRDELITQLAKPDAKYCWNLGIQFQTSPEMSIDNLLVSWPENESPFFTVGRLTVEHQIIDFQKQYNFCENLKFAPWHGLAVHRPVGALNRLRGFVYPLVAAYRHKKIGDDYKEPNDFEMRD